MMNICYSCLDQIHFQFHGQTDRYWKHTKQQAESFIAEYESLGRPLIHCEHCGSHVRYVLSADGKWTEETEEVGGLPYD